MQTLSLHNGIKIPQIGFGCATIKAWQDSSDYVTQIIAEAIGCGYRHLDTASMYKTEGNVAQAISRSGLPREDFFITTKVDLSEMGYDECLRAAEASLKRLNTDYIDLYLVHWPLKDKYLDTWKALERLYEEGVLKAIGGSNFAHRHFEGISLEGNIKPMVNQVELHPFLQQDEMRAYCESEGIVVTAWSPLGTGSWSSAKPEEKPLAAPLVLSLAEKYQRDAGQIVLRFLTQLGVVAIPKSETPARIASNLDVFSFELSFEDMQAMQGLNRNFSISDHHSGNSQMAELV